MEISQIELMLPYIDCFQVGARNMQNFNLLRELGHVRKPVLMKRGIAATIEEVLLSAEYILSGGNYNLMLCERGVRTFETYTRNTMDISAIPVLKKLTHLPVLGDPSHGVGIRDLVPPMALASVAAGADGLLMEMHPNPDKAMSDGAQSLYPDQLEKLMAQLRLLAPVVGRTWRRQGRMMERVFIIGTGLIGASTGLALRAAGFAGRIDGWDSSLLEMAAALQMGAIDGEGLEPRRRSGTGAVGECDCAGGAGACDQGLDAAAGSVTERGAAGDGCGEHEAGDRGAGAAVVFGESDGEFFAGASDGGQGDRAERCWRRRSCSMERCGCLRRCGKR